MSAVSKDRLRALPSLPRIASSAAMRRTTRRSMMNIGANGMGLDLKRGQVLPLIDAVGVRIDCSRGRLWITEHRCRDDIMLEAGQSYEIRRRGAALIQVLKDADLALSEPASAPKRSSKLWFEGARGLGLFLRVAVRV
jgi:hypothetical protein